MKSDDSGSDLIEPNLTDDENSKAASDGSENSDESQSGKGGHGGSGKDADLQSGKQSESDRAAGKSS